jgi:chaperone required for assembly of F1-ATPase
LKRFYKAVTTQLHEGSWRVTLDGRAIKTAAGDSQLVPSLALAEAMAAEWAGQGEEIDPKAFQLRDLADFAIDVASGEGRSQLADEIAAFAASDTLCYRADPEEPLYQRQLAVWEPLLAREEQRHGVRFSRVSGVIHRPQPPETLERMRGVVATLDPFPLAALRMLTSLSASLVIGLAALPSGSPCASPRWRGTAQPIESRAQPQGLRHEVRRRRFFDLGWPTGIAAHPGIERRNNNLWRPGPCAGRGPRLARQDCQGQRLSRRSHVCRRPLLARTGRRGAGAFAQPGRGTRRPFPVLRAIRRSR